MTSRLRSVTADELDPSDELFDSFRADYPGFDLWLGKCAREKRVGWIVDRGERRGKARYGGVCIVHADNESGYGWEGRALKICSLKVSDWEVEGWGTIFVQKAVRQALTSGCSQVFVEVFPKYGRLLALLLRMGFRPAGASCKGETVLRRSLSPTQGSWP